MPRSSTIWRGLAGHGRAGDALEEEFETEIPDEDAEKITTVQQAIDYINSTRPRPESAGGPCAAAFPRCRWRPSLP